MSSSTPYSQTPSATVLPQPEQPHFTPIDNNMQNYSYIYTTLYIMEYQSGKHQTLYQMMDSIPKHPSAVSFSFLILIEKQSFLKQDHTYISWYKKLVQSIDVCKRGLRRSSSFHTAPVGDVHSTRLHYQSMVSLCAHPGLSHYELHVDM
jgi:hypothetical protein